MEFSEIVVKDNPGLCRCCLSEGCYKDMGSDYTWMNETEIYADMLLECFDISISQHNEGPNGPNRLICEVCITRLRDACYFKKQVLDSEKKFVDMVGRGEFKSKVVVYQTQMKAETAEEAAARAEDTDGEYLDDDMAFVDDELDQKHDESEVAASSVTADPLPVRNKRGRPKKATTTKSTKKKVKVEKNKNKALVKGEQQGGHNTPQTETEPTVDDSLDLFDAPVPIVPGLSAKQKRIIKRKNVLNVLLKSTVMPFRWLKSSYRCFYCYEIFQENLDLKNHQQMHLDDAIKKQTMGNYWDPIVYVDISNLACKECDGKFEDLYVLIDHLIDEHDVEYNKDVGVCMAAFKLGPVSVTCLVCGKIYYSFGPLLHHTNKHHKETTTTTAILCDVCGQHFKDVYYLKLHFKTVHENTGVLCTECGEKFETAAKLKTHQKNQHYIEKRYKCFVCSEIFQSHYKRSRHMSTEHNREVVKCPHCPKTFVFRSMMMTHVRDTHLKVRNHICTICGWRAFNSHRLKNHMYKHSGEKNFKCDACGKAFSTKKIMKAHFSRMHKAPPVLVPTMPYEMPHNVYPGH